VKQWKDLKIPTLPIAGISSAVEQPGGWANTAGAVAYSVASPANAGNAPSNATPLTMKFYQAYAKRWLVEPEGYGTSSSYTAVYVVADAIRRAASLESDRLVAALEKTDLIGVYGRIGFDPSPVYAPLQRTYRQSVVLKFVQKMRLSTELTHIFFRLSYNDYE
jgi:branched-chain amino acid transport system substrate-binding protein